MAKEKLRKGNDGKGTESDRDIDVHLTPTVEFLHEHITESLCDEVFREVRTNERQRKWTLHALGRFWLAVILVAPRSLSQLLEVTRRGDLRGFLPQVAASAEAFFEKCKATSSLFFMHLYFRFIELAAKNAPKRYCSEMAHLLKDFSDVVLIDASRLDKIAHRLKVFRTEKGVILPGCLLAVYDLFRGIATQLWFDADAAASEFVRALTAVDCLAQQTLVVGDRLYCCPKLFRQLQGNQCFGVFRRNKSVGIRKVRRLARERIAGGLLEDWLVEAGPKKDSLDLRLIVYKTNGKTHEALTNVLDPKRLTAQDIAALYPWRWKVERLFYDLKVVLNIKKLYAANPNAVAMQVYAAAMVHASFRIAQADIARKVNLPAEELSPAKLFPLLALASIKIIEAEILFDLTCKANRKTKLRKPSWKNLPATVVSLHRIRVQRRSNARTKPEYHKDRAKWKSITKIEGTEELT
jgi:hypothetical protein